MDKEDHILQTFNRFLRVVNLIKEAEKKPISLENGSILYPSEIQILCVINNNSGSNITNIAKITGVTKGAVSQIIKKLETKKMVIKYHGENDREVLLKLTASAWPLINNHIKTFTQRECNFMSQLSSLERNSLKIVDDLFDDFENIMKNYLKK